MKNNGGDTSLSNYVYCARRTHHVHSIVCATNCRYNDLCDDFLNYEESAREVRKVISKEACGKQLRLVKEEGREEEDGVRTV